ncbi:MAG: redoxin domain-containing protein [Planctomycetes bacterium]|nr:redoxin domain-containing protein [Planctomycetota bacterium]
MRAFKLVFGLCIGIVGCLSLVHPLQAQDAQADYVQLAKELEVRELNTLMFAKYNDANLAKIAAFLEKHREGPEREKVLYLRAYSIWSLRRYEQAPQAYAALLAEFPKTKFKRLARIREAAAYLFSGQAEKALPRLQSLQKDHPDKPEIYARELAYALSRCGKQKEALRFMDAVEAEMAFGAKDRLLPRIKTHFDKVRLIGKPLQAFSVKDHRTGQTISPKTLNGKVVLIDFWATWCGPCLAEMPHVAKAHRELSEKGFVVFGVSLDEDQAKMDRMIAKRKMDWLHHFDGKKWKNELAVAFDVHSIPASLMIDRAGIVRAVNLRGREVAAVAKSLLQQK